MIAIVFHDKLVGDVNIILTGLEKSKWSNKILKVNTYIEKPCKDEINIYYLEQGCNWVHKDQWLNTSLYYKDYLHIIELKNHKFTSKIVKMKNKAELEKLAFNTIINLKIKIIYSHLFLNYYQRQHHCCHHHFYLHQQHYHYHHQYQHHLRHNHCH